MTKRKTLKDFDEAYKYGVTITLEELNEFDKLLNKIKECSGEDNTLFKRLSEIREYFL